MDKSLQTIEWKPELYIGIDSIDEDHRHLIDLINHLIVAIEQGFTQKEILSVFDELDAYTRYHFEREESFMKEACLSDRNDSYVEHHLSQHRYFISKLPELKRKLTEASSKSAAFSTIEFLLQWLLNHIINEDLRLAQCIHDAADPRKKESLLQKLIRKTRELTTLHQRLWAIVLIPMFFLVVLSSFISYNAHKQHTKLERIEELATSMVNINRVIAQLQIERGLSSAYIASGYTHFKEALDKQRKKTSEAIQKSTATRTVVQRYVDIAGGVRILEHLKQVRRMIDDRSMGKEESAAYYTGFIDTLIDLIRQITYLPFNAVEQNTYAPLLLLLHMNEIHGHIRKEGTSCLAMRRLDGCKVLTPLFKERETYAHMFEMIAPDNLLNSVRDIETRPYRQKMLKMYDAIQANSISGNHAAEQWFSVTSEWIEAYKKIIDESLRRIHSNAVAQKDHFLSLIMTIWGIFIIMLLFIAISIYLLKESIIKPIDILTDALYALSNGNKKFYFSTMKYKDAIGRMERAYNRLRRSLIKADYAGVLMQLQQFKTEQYVELSEKDALTEAYNRRAFMHAMELAVVESKQQQKPLSLFILDLDHFKKINDTYGHDVGDKVLKVFSDTIMGMIRQEDLFARIGGEEFALLLPGTPIEDAKNLAERIIREVSSIDLSHLNENIGLSVSIGISYYKMGESDMRKMLKEADRKLYEAKRSGRGRYCE